MTAHWIGKYGDALQFKTSLIAFQRLWGKHTGKNLAEIILKLLDRVGVTSKVKIFKRAHQTNRLSQSQLDWPFHHGQRSK